MHKTLILRNIAQKLNMNYYEKDLLKTNSLRCFEKCMLKAKLIKPSLLHFKNTQSLLQIVRTMHFQEQEQNYLKFLAEIFHKFKISINETNSPYK